MSLRVLTGAAALTAASLLPSVAVTAAPSSPAPAAVASASPATAPSAPQTPSVTRGHGQITVSWTAPASTGGSPVTAYRVRVEPGHRLVAVAAPATTAAVTGLADGTQVTATVEAVNAVGTSPTADAGTAIPSPPITGDHLPPEVEAHLRDLAVAPDQTLYAATDHTIYQRPFGTATFTALDLGTIAPSSIAVDAGNDLYWADEQSGGILIRRFADGQVTTVAGTTSEAAPWPSTTPTPALATAIPSVLDLAVNHSDGSVFILDYPRSTIYRFTIGGDLAVVAGDPDSGSPGTFEGDGGPAVDAHFNGPQGLAISEYGTVYVAETWSHRVRAFTVGGTIETVAGDGSQTIDPGADLDATATGVPYPSRLVWMPTKGLLIDSVGRKRLLVADRVPTDHLQRIGDDAFDRALLDSTFPPGDGPIGANDNTRSLAWDGE
ncbi:MAG: fibronectin type III domain-containing protein, partial [Aquihabitans sp.]